MLLNFAQEQLHNDLTRKLCLHRMTCNIRENINVRIAERILLQKLISREIAKETNSFEEIVVD